MNIKTVRLLICVLATVVTFCGCGPGKPDWESTIGKVTFQGDPVARAEVVFYSQSSPLARIAETDDQGRFECKTHLGSGLPAGEYQVVVRPIFVDPVLKGDWDPYAPIPPMSRKDIPKDYRKRKTSSLTFNVVEGDNEMDIVLKK